MYIYICVARRRVSAERPSGALDAIDVIEWAAITIIIIPIIVIMSMFTIIIIIIVVVINMSICVIIILTSIPSITMNR